MMTTISNLEKKKTRAPCFPNYYMSFLYAQQRVSEKLFKSSSPRSGREPRIPLLCFLPWKVHFYVHFAAFILKVLPTSGLSCRQGQSCQPMAYPVDRARAPTWILTLCHVSWLTYFLGYSLVLTLVFQSGPSRHCNTDHGRWWVSDLLMHQEAASVDGSRLPGGRSHTRHLVAVHFT